MSSNPSQSDVNLIATASSCLSSIKTAMFLACHPWQTYCKNITSNVRRLLGMWIPCPVEKLGYYTSGRQYDNPGIEFRVRTRLSRTVMPRLAANGHRRPDTQMLVAPRRGSV